MTAMASLRMLGIFLLLCVTLVNGQSDYVDVFGTPEPEALPCECAPYYQCDVNGTIITEARRSVIDVRGDDITNGVYRSCNVSTHVCCKVPYILTGELTTPKPTQTSTGCGRRNPNGVSFIVTGATDGEAQFGEFPWMVALLFEMTVEGSAQKLTLFVGGGSLIHPRVVLTAAHNVYSSRNDAQALKIRAGEWDPKTNNEILTHQDRKVREVIIHEGYDDDQLLNDVALLVLRDPVTADEHIDLVCLPSQGQNFDFSDCFVNGWGKEQIGLEAQYQTIPKKIAVPVVPRRPTCQYALREVRLGPYFLLHESFICAGGNDTDDTCKVVGGSPLVCPIANHPAHYQQAGIVAWSLCGEKVKAPGVYANVALYRNWIDQKMSAKNFDTSSYTQPN